VNGTVAQQTDGRSTWTSQLVVRVYRATGGRLPRTDNGLPLLLLTTVGRRTGVPRTTAVAFIRDAERFVVAGTNRGRGGRPSWCVNLRADPSARVEVGRESWEVRAVSTSGRERDRWWDMMCQRQPGPTRYPAATDLVVPVFVLEPVS